MICRLLAIIAIFFLYEVSPGAVGSCRSECVELNKFKIVRVHLKDQWVMAGVCRNTSMDSGDNQATVFPFICDRSVGIWLPDETDEEGVVNFPMKCPKNAPVDPVLITTCPKGELRA